MPTINQNATSSISLNAGQWIDVKGTGVAVPQIGPTKGQPQTITNFGKVGPFDFAQTVSLTSTNGVLTYSLLEDWPDARAEVDSTGNPTGQIVTPDGDVVAGAKYLGQVATRCFVPRQRSGTSKQINFRRFVRSAAVFTAPVLRFPNFFVANGTTSPAAPGTVPEGENGSGGAFTLGPCYVEHNGTSYPVTFGGASTVTIQDGSWADSDPVTGLSMVPGEPAWVRGYGQFLGAGNVVLTNTGGPSSNERTLLGEGIETAVSGLSPKGPGVALSNTINGVSATDKLCYGPCLVYAMSSSRSFAWIGDSHPSGLSSVGNFDASGNYGRGPYAVGMSNAYALLSTGGDKLQTWLASNTARAAMLPYFTDVLISAGTNDLSSGRTAAQLLADARAVAAIVEAAGARVWFETVAPASTSSNNWTDYAGQTVISWNTERVTYNDALRAEPATARRGLVDIADVLEVSSTGLPQRNSGRIVTNGVANAYTPDGIHLSAQGVRLPQVTSCYRANLGLGST